MKTIVKIVKSPFTWIGMAIICLVGVIIWAVSGRKDIIEDLRD